METAWRNCASEREMLCLRASVRTAFFREAERIGCMREATFFLTFPVPLDSFWAFSGGMGMLVPIPRAGFVFEPIISAPLPFQGKVISMGSCEHLPLYIFKNKCMMKVTIFTRAGIT